MAQHEKRQEVGEGRRQGSPSGQGLQRTDDRRSELAPWAARSPMSRMMAEMDWMFDQMQRRFFGAPLFESMAPWRGERSMFGRTPQLEFEDTDDAVIVHAEIPGVDPKDLHLECRDDVLTIRAESREEQGSEEQGGRYRRHASFYRQISLPSDVDVDRAEASCRNGVLTVRFPRRADTQSVKRIPISGETRSGERGEERRDAAA